MLEEVEAETRQRLVEVFQLWNFLDLQVAQEAISQSDHLQSLRGLWLVSLYAVVEKTVNHCVEAVIRAIEIAGAESNKYKPAVHSVLQASVIQSLRDCKRDKSFLRSVELFEKMRSAELITTVSNPFGTHLQNVDGGTMLLLLRYFGADGYDLPLTTSTKLESLRERRNAVAHGRESPSEVGSRFTNADLKSLYELVSSELYRFIDFLRQYCLSQNFLVAA